MKIKDVSRWRPEVKHTPKGTWITTGQTGRGDAVGYRTKDDYMGVEIIQTPDGPYVRFNDYEELMNYVKTLEAKLKRAAKMVASLKSHALPSE